jgi:hypothetical protein
VTAALLVASLILMVQSARHATFMVMDLNHPVVALYVITSLHHWVQMTLTGVRLLKEHRVMAAENLL